MEGSICRESQRMCPDLRSLYFVTQLNCEGHRAAKGQTGGELTESLKVRARVQDGEGKSVLEGTIAKAHFRSVSPGGMSPLQIIPHMQLASSPKQHVVPFYTEMHSHV